MYFLCEKINRYAQKPPVGAVQNAHLTKYIKGHFTVVPHIHMKYKVYNAPYCKFNNAPATQFSNKE